jgi:hypothetical protein
MYIQLPKKFVVRRNIQAIQYFGQSLIETIPAGEVILAERASHYARMIEVAWQARRFLVFERDLAGCAEPLPRAAVTTRGAEL